MNNFSEPPPPDEPAPARQEPPDRSSEECAPGARGQRPTQRGTSAVHLSAHSGAVPPGAGRSAGPVRPRRLEREAGLVTILAIGPRELPRTETVEVWFDAGSGLTGQRFMVPVKQLTLSDLDRGEGRSALYEYESHHREG